MVKSYLGSKGLKKTAFDINIDPSSVVGALTGAFVANKKLKKDNASALADMMSGQNLVRPSYYEDVKRLDKNTDIVFTPLGVLYVLDDGMTKLVVDQISVTDMDENVRSKFNAGDKAFFKNVMMNKVRSDIDIAEKAFAGRMIDKKMGVGFNKKAASIEEHLSDIKDAIEKGAAEKTIDYILDEEPLTVSAAFSDEVSINKVAFLGQPLEFLGTLGQTKEEKLKDPAYVAKKARIEFMPDRVLFIADDMVVGQLGVLNMNEDGFEAFERQDKNYFHDFFTEALGVKKPGILDLFKRASVDSESDAFNEHMVDARVYKNILDRKYGKEWLSFDPSVLIKEIEEDFLLGEAVPDLVMNKVMMIQAANNPKALIFQNISAFEKALRAVNDKPIDFFESERNISLGEFVYGLKVLNEVSPFQDIFELLSPGVIHYTVDTLASENYRVIYPLTDSPLEKEFYDVVDGEVRKALAEYAAGGSLTKEAEEMLKHDNMVAAQARLIIDELRESGEVPEDLTTLASGAWDKIKSISKFMQMDTETLTGIVARGVEDNIAVDVYVAVRDSDKEELLLKFRPEEGERA